MLAVFLSLMLAATPTSLPMRADDLKAWMPGFTFNQTYEQASLVADTLRYEYEDPEEAGLFFGYTIEVLPSRGSARDYYETLDNLVRETFTKKGDSLTLVIQQGVKVGERAICYQVENQGAIVGMVTLICDGKRVYSCTLMGAYFDQSDMIPFIQPILNYSMPKSK